jgi:hypothetical protein
MRPQRQDRALSRGRITVNGLKCQIAALADLLVAEACSESFSLDELRAVSAELGDALLDIDAEIERRAAPRPSCGPWHEDEAR